MSLLEEIINESVLLTEDVSVSSISDAINTMRPAYIKYDSGGKGRAMGRRLIYPVAYGLSTAGNPVVRAFEEQGDTLTGVPAWKFFRVDRIMWWRTVKDESRSFKNKKLVGLNQDGTDKGMIQIFAISPLCGKLNKDNEPEIDSYPVTKGDVDNGGQENKEKQEKPRKFWNPQQIGQNIVDFFRNWKTKYQKEPEVSLDNDGNITYNNGTTTQVQKMKAPDNSPVTKGEIEKDTPSTVKSDSDEIDKMRADDNSPVTKADIDGEEQEENEPEITRSFNDMNRRWNDLEKQQQ